MEAGNYARFESAAEHLDEVGAQFEHGRRFTVAPDDAPREAGCARSEPRRARGADPRDG